MNPTLLLVGIAAFFVVLAVIFVVAKGVVKVIFSIFSVISFLVLIGGVFVAMDAMEMQGKFQTEEKKIILENENEALVGLLTTSAEEEPAYISEQELDIYSLSLEESNLAPILEDSYKLIVIDLDVLKNLEKETISFGEDEYEKDMLIQALESDNPKQIFMEKQGGAPDKEDNELKALVFGQMFNEVMQNPVTFIDEYKQENIIFYPETAVFKAIKILPAGLFKSAMENMVSKVEEKIPSG